MISGSAEPLCETAKLRMASRSVSSFTREVLSRGGGVVVLAGDELPQDVTNVSRAFLTGLC